MKQYKSNLPEIQLKYKKGDVLKCKIQSSKDAYDLFMKFLDQDTFEVYESVIVLFLNNANNTLGWMKHTTGGMTQSVVDTRLIFVTALQCGATQIMISHNHTSGQTAPSSDDKVITRKLKDGATYLGVRLLDHIICANDSYYSFADDGLI